MTNNNDTVKVKDLIGREMKEGAFNPLGGIKMLKPYARQLHKEVRMTVKQVSVQSNFRRWVWLRYDLR